MNVLHVNKYYYPETGGVERVVQTLAEGIATRGHDVRVLASTPRGLGSTTDHRGVVVEKTMSAGVLQSVPIAPLFPLVHARAVRWADVVHHHVPNPLGTVSHLSVPTGTPSVATYHSDIVRQQTALRLYRPIQQQFLRQLDHIFVTSPVMLEHSSELGPHRDRSSVAPLSVDLDEYPSPDEPLDTHRDDAPAEVGDTDRPVVLFVGRLNYYKGVKHLVRAAQWIDADVLIAGDGERRERLVKLTAELDVTETVEFLGHVPEEHLVELYRAADVFVLPSVEQSEAFGIVQLEAMSQATPVVNTELPSGVPWVSRDGQTGITVEPADPKAIADAVSVLLDDDTLRTRYGEAARQRVEDEFSDRQLVETVLETYRGLV